MDMKRKLCNELVKQGKVEEGDVIRHSYTSSRFASFHIENKDNHNCCSTLTTRADCIGVVEKENMKQNICISDDGVIVPEKTKKGFAVAQEGDGIYTNRPYQKRGCVQKDKIQSLKTSVDDIEVVINNRGGSENKMVNNYRIRKLTPKEVFRLQGVKDEDYEKIAKNQSNASLYHLAGDSITTSVLMAIFGEILGVDYKSKIHELEKSIAPEFDWSIVKEDPKEIKYEQVDLMDLL